MRHKDRVMSAFRGEWADRPGIFEQAFASSVASKILGRRALTGSTSLHYEESRAWMRGESAHAEFLDRVYEDTVALARALDLDAIYPPWRFGTRPTRQVDEYTFLYGDESGDGWVKMSFDPASETYGVVARGREPTSEDVAQTMRAAIAAAAREPAPSTERLDPFLRRLLREHGGEYAIPTGGAGLSIPIQRAWLEATLLDRALVEEYLDARVESNLRWLPVYKAAGADYINGGGDFADKNGPVYSPRFFCQVMAPRWQRIFQACRAVGLPYVMRSDGNLWPVAEELFGQCRPEGYGEVDWDAGMDPARVRAAFPELVIFGSVPCGGVLLRGTPRQVAETAEYCLRAAGPRVVLGSSNAILHGTPPENVHALFEVARRFKPPRRRTPPRAPARAAR